MSLPRREPDDLIWLDQGIALVARIHVLLDRSARLMSSAGAMAAAAAAVAEPAARTDIAVPAPAAARRRHG